MLTELFSAVQRMDAPLTVVVVLNGFTLLGVINIARKMGQIEKMFALMWADFAERKGLKP